MSLERCCDAYGNRKGGVKRHGVYLHVLDADGKPGTMPLMAWETDLTPRGVGRLAKFIKRGTSSATRAEEVPGPKAKEAVADAS